MLQRLGAGGAVLSERPSLLHSLSLFLFPSYMLLNSSSYCSPHSRPVNQEMGLGGQGIATFIQKTSRPRRWWTSVPKYHLAWVWMLVSFIKHRGGGKEIK